MRRRTYQRFIAVRDEVALLPDNQLQQQQQQQLQQQQQPQVIPVKPNLQLSAGVNEPGRHSRQSSRNSLNIHKKKYALIT